MGFHYFAGAAYRALTARKDGPSLYDVCDPLLLDYRGGDPHLGKFYRTALGNPALRPLLRRTGLPQLRDERRMTRLREALKRARDDEAPDWADIGTPIAELMATRGQFLEALLGNRNEYFFCDRPHRLPLSIIRIINLASRDRDGRMVLYCDRVGPRNASRGSRAGYSRSSFE